MKRYALPIGILAGILILLVLVFIGGPNTPDYSSGTATEPSISEEWVRGDLGAAVKLIEYSDFQCPACQAYYPMIKQLEEIYATSSVAFIYRHYPLFQVHANADFAARVSEAAGRQGKFWEMHDLLFEKHDEWASLLDPKAKFTEYATALGLSLEKFNADVDSDVIRKQIADDFQRGNLAGVQGTPTFVLNGQKIARNPESIEEFESIINTALPIK